MPNTATRTITLTVQNWLLAKYVRHRPDILLDPSVEAAAVRKAIAEAGPFRRGEPVILVLTEDAADWLIGANRDWIEADPERDGAFAVATWCDEIEDALEALDGIY